MLYITFGIAAMIIISIQASAYYYFQKSYPAASKTSTTCSYSTTNSASTSNSVEVNALLNYGNGTLHWYNQTVPSTWNSYELTQHITRCNVESDFYGRPLNEHFVRAINGVVNSNGFSWALWTYCQKSNAWVYSHVGADLVQLPNGQTIGWVYENSSQQPPVPGARTTDSC
ncbi:MAG TPA: hypothetical protein VFE98_04185 [Candidatus Bathyarchaeia archaeon]|nr:hypothetical protein [Candidatus Bathyarchaeia archaeon]